MADAAQTSILVVDDEWLIRTDLADILAQAGYRIHEASNASEAISMLEKHREIRVVFTDIQMPGTMDGISLAHYIRQRWPPTVLVVSSGNPAPQPADLPENTDFLAKPMDKSLLDTVLVRVERKLAAG